MKVPLIGRWFPERQPRQPLRPYYVDLRDDPNRPWARQTPSDGHVSERAIADAVAICEELGFVVMRNYITAAQANNLAYASSVTQQATKLTQRRHEQIKNATQEQHDVTDLRTEYLWLGVGTRASLHTIARNGLCTVLATREQQLRVDCQKRKAETTLLAGDALLWRQPFSGTLHLSNHLKGPVVDFLTYPLGTSASDNELS